MNDGKNTAMCDEKMMELKRPADFALCELQKHGAEQAFCRISRSEKREFNVDGGEFSLYRTLFDRDASLMSISAGKRGVLKSNRIDEQSLAAAARDCVASAEAAEPDAAWQLAPTQGEHVFVKGDVQSDEEKLFARCEEFLAQLKRDFPLIVMEQMVVSHLSYEALSAYSSGSRFVEQGGYYSFFLMYSAHDGVKSSSFFACEARFCDLDQPFMDVSSVRDDLAKVSEQLNTVELEKGFSGTLLLTPATLEEFLSYACESFASDRAILEKSSAWLKRLGEAVADPRLSVKIAPKDERLVATENFTAEGYLSKDYMLIEKGVLQRFQLSDYAARKSGFERAPNTASGNFVMEGGEQPLAELIKGIKRGLWLGRFSGGSPSANGDFSGVAKNSFLIEDGEIKGALRETMINGNLADLLLHLRGISKETLTNGATVLPYVAFDGILVSGKT